MGFWNSVASFATGGASDLLQGDAPLSGALESVGAPDWVSGLVSPIGTSAARSYDAYKRGDNYSAIHNIMGLSPFIDDASSGVGRWANEKTDGSAGQVINTIAPVVGGMIGGVYGGPVGAMGGAAAGKMFAGRFNNLPEKDIQKGTAIAGATAYATSAAGAALQGAGGAGGSVPSGPAGGDVSGVGMGGAGESYSGLYSGMGGAGEAPAGGMMNSPGVSGEYATPGGDYLSPEAPQPTPEDVPWLKRVLDDPRTTDLAKAMAKKGLAMLIQAGMQGMMGQPQTFNPQPAPQPINTNYSGVPVTQFAQAAPMEQTGMMADPAWPGTNSTLPSNPLDFGYSTDFSLKKIEEEKDKDKAKEKLAAQLQPNYLTDYNLWNSYA